MALAKLISVDKDKCVNCHRCISVCPTKFPNNGADDYIQIEDDLCIGCGECVKACTHDARIRLDDFDIAMEALKNKQKVVAVVAPAISSNFPYRFLKFNGWLKSLGIDAVFDVSFGAELTVKTYLEHIKKNNPKAVIAQPCPAIVTYIEIYQPELIQYLAPADSPMLHTMKMIKEYYPQYKNHKLLVVSPCTAKKREFEETGIGDYNVTLAKLVEHIEEYKINLDAFPETDYDNDLAERAVLFSTPGGLLETAEREVPDIRFSSRKIEGPHTIYEYLKKLPEAVKEGYNPLLIDCLNCEMGCNGGTGTLSQDKSPDELEHVVRLRKEKLVEFYKEKEKKKTSSLKETIDKYWKPGLYDRKYVDHGVLFKEKIKIPTAKEQEEIYHSMNKFKEEDIKNCSNCGYNSCEIMAVAIHNRLNKKENCHYYLQAENDSLHSELHNKVEELNSHKHILSEQKDEMIKRSEHVLGLIGKLKQLTD